MAAVAHGPLINPTKSGKYSVLIDEDLLREENPRKRHRISVQYNHRPVSLDKQDALLKCSANESHHAYTLRVKNPDGKGSYQYTGSQKPSTSVALIYDPQKQAFVLHKIDAEFNFNLQSTPDDSDTASLTAKYPQLGINDPDDPVDTSASNQDDEDLDDGSPDPDNPYDYRHFLLHDAATSPQPSRIQSPAPNYTLGSSPLLKPTSPAQRAVRPPTARKKSPQRRRYLSPNPREDTYADNEDSDHNELVIDMGDSQPDKTKPWRSALGALNERGRSTGPISLRSAASSMSPSVRGESDVEDKAANDDVEEIDLGNSSLNGGNSKSGTAASSADGNGWDDEDGGIFEAELEQAMEQQAENEQKQQKVYPPESSSESEAE